MIRSSIFVLIAALAAASFLTEPAAAQIKLPKITIPKIKTEAPSSTEEAAATANSSIQQADSEVRGIPIRGAKITFSNNPDGSNPKTSFSSSEYIYGRLDLGGRTVYDAFGLKNQGANPKYYYINYDLQIYKPGEQPWENWGGSRNFTLLTKEEAQKTYWVFDVLPDPAKVSTMKSILADEQDYSKKFVAGIYSKWYDADSARSTFPQNGNYTIDVTVWGDAYDDWGKPVNDSKQYPTANARFVFQFSGTDGRTLVANAKTAKDNIEAAKSRSEMYHAMPDWWGKAWTGSDPRLAPARLVPMIKGYIGRWNLTYMKHMIWGFTGPAWVVQKNDLGIPRYRMFNSTIYIIYKDPKDNACNVGGLTMQEDYSGAGTYGEPYLSGISDVKLIDCSAVK